MTIYLCIYGEILYVDQREFHSAFRYQGGLPEIQGIWVDSGTWFIIAWAKPQEKELGTGGLQSCPVGLEYWHMESLARWNHSWW